MSTENKISKTKNVLLVLSNPEVPTKEFQDLINHFCGIVIPAGAEIEEAFLQKRIYVCGDVAQLKKESTPIYMYVIRELSFNYENRDPETMQIIGLGQVPIIVHDAGVYFRHFFEETDFFNRIKAEHEFQELTESTKPEKALRKGIYLTEVSKKVTADQKEVFHYHLLRCSSNFTGATGNFRETDRAVLKAMNDAIKYVFEQETTLNHVLAQIYENKIKTGNQNKEAKAKIKAHSDKTKDMPQEALIAFCTFYDPDGFQQLKPSKTDRYDWCYKEVSGLTRLHFKLKSSVQDVSLEKEFSILLYPNSVFFIPLSTNRLYTHEIKPSMLNIDKMPTRMGYVVRCSKTEAIFRDEQTFLLENETLIPLEPMNADTMARLKNSYAEENKTENRIHYGEVHFSMNSGDYQKPIY
jgi:hypothetical protein